MKVIKKGRQQKGWAKQITCTGKGNGRGGCGAVLLIEEPDLFQTSKHSYGDTYPEYFVTFKCSECGVLTDTNGWPGNAQDLPKEKAQKPAKVKAPKPETRVCRGCSDCAMGGSGTTCVPGNYSSALYLDEKGGYTSKPPAPTIEIRDDTRLCGCGKSGCYMCTED